MTPHKLTRPLITFFCLLLWTVTAFAGDEWKPLSPDEIALKTPVVEKDADAEALFWEVRVLDENDGGSPRTVLKHYIRIKIFTERGRESEGKVELAYGKFFGREIQIKDIAGRTIKADGTIIDLKKEDIFESTQAKANGLKFKAKTFALPGVEPGAIIEYRWREIRVNALANYTRLQFQRDIPVQRVTYWLKPLPIPGYGFQAQMFNHALPPVKKEKDGFYAFSLENMPAFREEPRMPPEDAIRVWMLPYYVEGEPLTPQKFWENYAKQQYNQFKDRMKLSDEVKKATVEAVTDATDPEVKVRRIFEYCRAKIKNINDDASGLTPEQYKALKENKSPADTLKRGMGTGTDIDMLFAAMVTAAGLEARVARTADRSDVFFSPKFADDYFISTYNIAVKLGDKWRFFDPATTYLPFGMLRWQEEGQPALLANDKEMNWQTTQISPPEKSRTRRVANLKLSEDGTLEGDVRMEYTGHAAADKKEFYDDDSAQERENGVKENLAARLSTAEPTDIKIENVTDLNKPFVWAYHVRVPGYAQRTGKRIFLQPAFFQKGLTPLFSGTNRRYEIYFNYPWSEQDEVIIELPDGYVLDNPDAPGALSPGPMSKYEATLSVTTSGKKMLVYKRDFFFGLGASNYNELTYGLNNYAPLKRYFEVVNQQDNHTITLKQNAGPAGSN